MKIYEDFIKKSNLDPVNFRSAWAFMLGNPWSNTEDAEMLGYSESLHLSDELAELVVKGIKTATSGDYASYARENIPIPIIDHKYDIILDSQGKPICAITTTKVDVVRFDEVSAEHAFKEGEGERTLSYW